MSRDGESVMEPDPDASNASQNLGDADPTQGTQQQRENEPLLTPEERTDMIKIIATTEDLEERNEILAILWVPTFKFLLQSLFTFSSLHVRPLLSQSAPPDATEYE